VLRTVLDRFAVKDKRPSPVGFKAEPKGNGVFSIYMTELKQTNERRRVLSGMRPTGKLHLGNYMGALYNWVKLQHEYECYFFIADFHALTTDYADPSRLLDNVYEITLDFLSAGLDPEKCTIFVQSHVPQHAELNLLFGMFTPLGWLERVPTYKDQQEELREKDLSTYGFLGYPLLQSADILVYQADYVPVGQDQVAHVELTREVARKFNQLYSPRHLVQTDDGSEVEEPDPARLILPEPQVLLTPSPKLPGLDGRKMSKSYGNSILLSEWPGDVQAKMSGMSNGGQRNPQTEPGDPDICPVGDMHRLFSEPMVLGYIERGCRTAEIRCSECKMMAANGINAHLAPIRERRNKLERDPAQIWRVLEQGAGRARLRAEEAMSQVREVTGLSRVRQPVPPKRRLLNGLAYDSAHDLSEQSDWWEIDRAARGRNLREHWRNFIVPSEIGLKFEGDRLYTTRGGKRVYVTTAREEPENSWSFYAKAKSYEVLVLLCWSKNFQLNDYIVPQSAYVKPWTVLKKTYGKVEVNFKVTREGDRTMLNLPGADAIDITSYRGEYRPIQ
jgi:tryptophanyl-tRNA synthetase